MKIRPYQASDEQAVIAIWRECGLTRPWNDPQRDITRKLTEQPELFLVAVDEQKPVGTAMVGFDGHRGWVYYLAVNPGQQRQSIGCKLMAEAERLLLERGCPKICLMVRSSNADVIAFYKTLGYAQDDVVTLGRRLIADD
jgi:ribosomal protein S18 acetylase RimI-like enzyme